MKFKSTWTPQIRIRQVAVEILFLFFANLCLIPVEFFYKKFKEIILIDNYIIDYIYT